MARLVGPTEEEMTNQDDITTIVPDPKQTDAELRALKCALEALDAVQTYMLRVAEARGRGPTDDLELVQDQVLDMRAGLRRASERRTRNVNTITKNTRLKAVG
jgi:hypothetical protein